MEVRNLPKIKLSKKEHVAPKLSRVSTSRYTRDGRVTNVGTGFDDKSVEVVFLDFLEDGGGVA